MEVSSTTGAVNILGKPLKKLVIANCIMERRREAMKRDDEILLLTMRAERDDAISELARLRAEVLSLQKENASLKEERDAYKRKFEGRDKQLTELFNNKFSFVDWWDKACSNYVHYGRPEEVAKAAYIAGNRAILGENAYLTQQLAAAKEYAERLAEAGQAVVDRWDSPDWMDGTHTIDYINRLRDAIRKSEG